MSLKEPNGAKISSSEPIWTLINERSRAQISLQRLNKLIWTKAQTKAETHNTIKSPLQNKIEYSYHWKKSQQHKDAQQNKTEKSKNKNLTRK